MIHFVSLQIQIFIKKETKKGNEFLLFILSSPHKSPKMTLRRTQVNQIDFHYNNFWFYIGRLQKKSRKEVKTLKRTDTEWRMGVV